MKIDINQENALIVGGDTTTFGLNLQDPSVFVSMLLNLYSDPISSSVREYLSNAWDANKESGTDKPIVVGLTKDKFWIQDYGLGLSPEFMKEGYCTIGYSTKRDNNQMIGAYGFGRVTFLSYVRNTTKQYWVHTVYQGVVYEYLIFLDGNTIKQTLLKSEPTNEPSGTRVVVQLDKQWREYDKWEEAIKEQCAYFEGTHIDLDGTRTVVEVTKDGFLWKSNLYNGYTNLILGSVYYNIPWDNFQTWGFLKHLKVGIHFGLDEGLIPVPSREAIIFDDRSTKIVTDKFKVIAEKIHKKCEEFLEDLNTKSDLEKLEFSWRELLPDCTYHTYKEICIALGKTPTEVKYDFKLMNNSLYRKIKDCFIVNGEGCYYSERWTSLKKQFVNHKAAEKKIKHVLDWCIEVEEPDRKIAAIKREQIINRLLDDYIKVNFLPFNEQGYEQWKKSRKTTVVKEKGVITYYRKHQYDDYQCTKDTGDIDLSKYRYVFKANDVSAKKYWNFIRNTFSSFIITTKYGMNLNEFEPSPLLKRMVSEALKVRVFNVLGNLMYDSDVFKLIKEVNPLLRQYIDEVRLPNKEFTDAHEALIEAGELLNCFDKDEVKLRFMEHHLSKLRILKYLGSNSHYNGYRISEEEIKIAKRYYVLERLAEHKWKEEPVNVNQLELELN